MKKISGLVLQGLDELVNGLLEKIREDEGTSKAAFRKKLKSQNKEIFNLVDNAIAKYYVNKFTPKYLTNWWKKSRSNQSIIIRENKAIFLYYTAYLEVTYSIYRNLIRDIDSEKENVSKQDSLMICMYGNICRMADEIGTSLINGYHIASLKLWRSFYEHIVISIFLMERDSEDLIEKFSDYSHKGYKKRLDSYEKHFKDLKLPPLTTNAINVKEKLTKEIVDKNGDDFLKQEYSWAKDYLNERPTFWAIEKSVNEGRYRPFYIWASGFCHPSFESITNFRDDEHRILLHDITKQTYEQKHFIDPMQLTLATFQDLNNYFLYRYSTDGEYNINLLLLRKIYEKFQSKLG